LAIQLSLETQKEDEDMRRAIAASIEESKEQSSGAGPSSSEEAKEQSSALVSTRLPKPSHFNKSVQKSEMSSSGEAALRRQDESPGKHGNRNSKRDRLLKMGKALERTSKKPD
jgi:hypothetical protein